MTKKINTQFVNEFYEIDKVLKEVIKTEYSFKISISLLQGSIMSFATIRFFDDSITDLVKLLLITPAREIGRYYKEAKINVDDVQTHELRLDVPLATFVKNALLAEKRYHRESKKLKKYLISIGKLTPTK
jgi:hypothetical protein